ncbi:MAG: dockerin type I repeat-containing protein [candidate division Zixibacteria bacterium]|nr:dockerin type I repeat-containing protein [candidate division Zixibacteria bacterium]
MLRRLVIINLLILVFIVTAQAENRKQARLIKIDDLDKTELRVRPSLTTADTCIVRHDAGIYYKIDSWVAGAELYKGYLDPAACCPSPYPFTITEINMPMYFFGATPLNVSVDVEGVDLSVPNCPFPGELLTVSNEYAMNVPGTGLYDVWIPLDTPITVNGPFFAGFYISNIFDPADSPAVVIDTIPMTCATYNIWDDSIGWIDMGDNQFYNFPGRLVLYASGIPASGNGGPLPEVSFLFPQDGDTLYGNTSLWGQETTGSSIISYAQFEYLSGSIWINIGQDVDGTSAFRDGLNYAGTGNGFSAAWNFGGLSEGPRTLRAAIYDTLGNVVYDTITVFLEPTPPIPDIVSPEMSESFCSSLELLFSCPDENIEYIQVLRTLAENTYSAGMQAAGPSSHGPQYNAPLAAAMVLKLWYDRGYQDLMKESFSAITVDSLANKLANVYMNTASNMGTYDDDLINGLMTYFEDKNIAANIDFLRSPDYFALREWVENYQRGVLLGLGGTPGQWVAVDGFTDWEQSDGTYKVNVANPLTGIKHETAMRKIGSNSSLYLNGSWRQVDIMVSAIPLDWEVSGTTIGVDIISNDGWSIAWTPTGLTEGNWYNFLAVAGDATNLKGKSSILLNYDCSSEYVKGDYNGDRLADIKDIEYLLQFILFDGEQPVGGGSRADANGDGQINIADVIYCMNYIFGAANPPSY